MRASDIGAPEVRTPGGNPANADTGSGVERSDCHGAGVAQRAAEVIEGEGYARAWLQRMQAGTAQPGELAVILSFLGGEMLHGACRLLEKALEARR